jgi:hypothetical protein
MMKALKLTQLLFCVLLFGTPAFSQILPPGLAAKFGIDGDINSDERQSGAFTAAGSHDWFMKNNGSGLGLFDTTGASVFRQQIMTGNNVTFLKRMQYMRYSAHDGVVLLDACYSRDYIGNDKTSFIGNGTKNTTSPMLWGTAPGGSSVSDKTDILETYVSMRRSGTELTGNNIGNLVATMALATLATGGDRYADFEFYKERISYNTTTGLFENSGPAVYGGHSLWEFNADGSIKSWGDMIISFTFSSSAVSDIKVYIWVSQAAYQTIDPNGFDFVPNNYNPSTSVSGYGYAAIKPNGNGQVVAWGVVNTAAVSTPVWGSNSKDLGSNTSNYFSDQYSVGQFAEAAVDLTSLGMDPSTYSDAGACNPPFSAFLTKARSSSSFSSALSDFNGPFDFLSVPSVPAAVATPAALSCVTASATLSPATYTSGAYYTWQTNDGRVVSSNADSSSITVDKPGTYYLFATSAKGCPMNLDSVTVPEDRFKPVATASAAGMLYASQTVQLYGGDTTLSNYTTPFGGSKGLEWEWTGPFGFYAIWQNPITSVPGWHTLVVTEKRNGCKDTALVYVVPYPSLPVTFDRFTVQTDEVKRQHLLSWRMANTEGTKEFSVERSADGIFFRPAARLAATPFTVSYAFKDPVSASPVYYRIKAVDFAGRETYSNVVKAGNSTAKPQLFLTKEGTEMLMHYKAFKNETVDVSLFNGGGYQVWKEQRTVREGENAWRMHWGQLPPGIYVLQINGKSAASAVKLVW